MIAQESWERRLRRALNKYGYCLHRIRGKKGEYTVEDELGNSKYYSSLLKVQFFVEDLNIRNVK